MKYLKCGYVISALIIMFFYACEPKNIDTDESDINYPKSEITSFAPASAEGGTQVTLSGERMDDVNLRVYIGNTECKILSQKSNSVVIELPRVIVSDFFSTINSLNATSTAAEKFVVLYPNTTIDKSSLAGELFKDVGYTITGSNLDFITAVVFKDTTVLIDGTQVKDPATLKIVTKESNPAKPKFKAIENISFVCRSGNELPTKIGVVVSETYPLAELVVVDSKVAAIGDEVKFIFDDYNVAKLITNITIGGVDAKFSFSEPYVLVTIPIGATDGAISITNSYGVVTAYADGEKLSLN